MTEVWTDYYSCDGLGSCHLTWPELNCHEKSFVKLEKLERYLDKIMASKDEFDYEAMPTRYLSLLNLKGFVFCKQGKYFFAQKTFEKVLKADAKNLCALGNLMNIHQKLGRKRAFKAKLELYDTVYRENQALVKARYYNAKAHAMRYFQQDMHQFTYFRYAETSAHIGFKYYTDSPEKAEWFFDYGLALFRRYSTFAKDSPETSDEANNVHERAISCFEAVIQVEDSWRRLKALSWIFVGILLGYKSAGKSFSHPFSRSGLVYGSEECFAEALSLDGLHPYVTRRLGAEYVKAGKYEKAEEYLDQSLKALPTGFAHRYRGLLFLKRAEDVADRDEAKVLLLKAKSDFEKTFEDYSADYSNLGYVLYLLGSYEEALSYFALAENGDHDDFFNLSRTYERWSDCLLAIGENESAKEKRGQGKQIQSEIRRACHNGVDSMFRFVNIVRESEYSELDGSEYGVPASLVPEGDMPEHYDYFIWYNHQSAADRVFSLSLIKRLEDAGLIGRLEQRDFLPGKAIPNEIVESVEKCQSTVFVISSSVAECPWGQMALCTALRCQRIVPIILDDCKVPETLICYTSIRVHKSRQLSECDWKRLLKRLRDGTKSVICQNITAGFV